MKYKNIFFITCASIIIISKISAMLLGTQQVTKSIHRIYHIGPMLQKRNFNIDPDLVAFLWIVGGIMCANYIDETLGASREAEKKFFKIL